MVVVNSKLSAYLIVDFERQSVQAFYVQAEILKRNVNERKQKFASNQVANAQHFSENVSTECLRCGCRRLDMYLYVYVYTIRHENHHVYTIAPINTHKILYST